MATDPGFIVTLREALVPLNVSARAMFGEYGLYYKGKNFALVCDNTLFVKVTEPGRAVAGRIATASPYPGAKPAFKISSAGLKDREWLLALVQATSLRFRHPNQKRGVPRNRSPTHRCRETRGCRAIADLDVVRDNPTVRRARVRTPIYSRTTPES